MKLRNSITIGTLMLVLGFSGCQQDPELAQKTDIPQATLDKIYQMGFGTNDVQQVDNGYLVEGDIFLSESVLNDQHDQKFLRIGETEQYRTTNLVYIPSGSKRTITVSLASKLPTSYGDALNEAIKRYNAENLLITFQRVASNGNIQIVNGNGSYLASAGFPSGGNPYNQVKVNTRSIGNQPLNTVASILAHEMGHCIGFRHTDYMNRAYSCGGSATNEGASTVGAILIPGTPSGPDPNSWMLSCIGSGMNRPFNANDRTALSYLY
ncbi:M57 family metalloprotease [Adhaeribacter radiodurans]|uniref:Protease n=1 Tax=Adhaeribacter radiodurans TaxID=2745197 RepID=A0A7L7L1Q7_9BACT|nr:M57 family metalloprotease [Adhaeribacter radiodurans]QMU26726.1 protease [Adhaeribacter radiodurans]